MFPNTNPEGCKTTCYTGVMRVGGGYEEELLTVGLGYLTRGDFFSSSIFMLAYFMIDVILNS